MSGLLYYLCLHPTALHRLRTEIHTSFATDSDITFASTRDIKYLNACLSEAMRLYPPAADGLPKICPPPGAHVDGFWVPGGTICQASFYSCSHAPMNWTDAEDFRPERWMGTQEHGGEFDGDVLEASQPFSRGPRGCLGEKFAWQEMRVIFAKLLWHFDVELREESRRWMEEQVCYFLWQKGPLWVKLTERAA
jgi:cytochrome P450